MSEIFSIASSLKSYEVELNPSSISLGIDTPSDYIVVDGNVHRLWPSLKLNDPIIIEAFEQNKVLSTVGGIVEDLRAKGASRSTELLAIGGGIIQDVSTFSASCFMRGVKWSYAPTTLLGMVDSCIGGKSSINVGQYKNIAGNFYPPEKILIDTQFCKTLSEQQLVEGLCESVKICFAYSEQRFLDYLNLIDLESSLHEIDFNKVVSFSLKTKKKFIEEDEFDNGIRLLLNFGHTFGHALESASEYKISHGVAVGLGMFSAYKQSVLLGLIEEENLLVDLLMRHVRSLLKRVKGLDALIKDLDMQLALEGFKSDKKHLKDEYIAILYGSKSNLVRYKFSKNHYHEQCVLESFEYLRGLNFEI